MNPKTEILTTQNTKFHEEDRVDDFVGDALWLQACDSVISSILVPFVTFVVHSSESRMSLFLIRQ